MNFLKIRLKSYYLSSIFLIINITIKIHCLIEFPISQIRPNYIPKYPDFKPDSKIPEELLNKLIKKNSEFSKKIYSSSDSGEMKIITNLLFVIDVEIGSSKQIFNLLLDTGSSTTWVPDVDSIDLYPIIHHYDSSLSSSSSKIPETFEISYGSGYVKGNYFSDKMIYLYNKEFVMDFGVAERTNFIVNGADGILGLSRIYEDFDKSFIHMICKGHVTNSKLFSVKLGLNTTNEKYGKFYIGKHEDFDKDDVVSCELRNDNYYEQNYWACDIFSFSVDSKVNNKKYTSEQKISVIFDTGTNAIFLPYSYLKDMVNDLETIKCYPKKYSTLFQPVRYQLICTDDIPDFEINIGGHTFILPGKYFFYYDKQLAYSDIYFQDSSNSEEDVFIIGSPFFVLFHVLFDAYSKELFFYPEIKGLIIKGNWWNTKHIIIVILLIIIILSLIGLIVGFIYWKRKNKYVNELGIKYEIRSYFGLL